MYIQNLQGRGACRTGLKTTALWQYAVRQESPDSVLEGRCPAEFSSNPNQAHLNQLINVLLGVLETSSQACRGKLELNSAGHRPSRIKFGDPCCAMYQFFWDCFQRFWDCNAEPHNQPQFRVLSHGTGARWLQDKYKKKHFKDFLDGYIGHMQQHQCHSYPALITSEMCGFSNI